MRFWIYLLSILYVLSPYDLVPDFFIGGGWLDDIIVLGLLFWYHFIYQKKRYSRQQGSQGYRYSKEGNRGRFREGASSGRGTDFGRSDTDRDPYEVLEVKKGASVEEIKGAYKRLAKQYHPDKVTHLGEEFRVLAEKRFKEIQKAYQKLKVQG